MTAIGTDVISTRGTALSCGRCSRPRRATHRMRSALSAARSPAQRSEPSRATAGQERSPRVPCSEQLSGAPCRADGRARPWKVRPRADFSFLGPGLEGSEPYNGWMRSDPPYADLTPDTVLDALASAGLA